MADDKKMTYLQMPVKWWWDLRTKFKQTLPNSISDSYIATVLGVSVSSAKGVAIPQFKLTGIVNQDGTTTNEERARAWRDDEQYPQICQTIIEERYPQELRDAFPNPTDDDRSSIEQWFSRTTGVGSRAARGMTSFYLMLTEANISKAPDSKKQKPVRPVSKTESTSKAQNEMPLKTKVADEKKQSSEQRGNVAIPSININVQVHISSDASTEQIDNIFSSMARHLDLRRSNIDG